MSEAYTGGRACDALPDNNGSIGALGAADWLMPRCRTNLCDHGTAYGFFGDGPSNMLCSTVGSASPLGGMVPMYLLMSAFHSAPWLKLIFGRRSGVRQL